MRADLDSSAILLRPVVVASFPDSGSVVPFFRTGTSKGEQDGAAAP